MVRRYCLVVAILFMLQAAACAEKPQAVISGPSTGQLGDLIVLDGTASTGDFWAWEVTPKLPDNRTTIFVLNERQCLLCSVPGTYHVFLAVGNAEGVDIAEWVVKVGGAVPDPVDPVDPSDPVLPVGRFGLAKLMFDSASRLSDTGKAGALAESFRSMSARVSAGTITDIEDLKRKTIDSNRAAVGTDRDLWVPVFTDLQSKLDQLEGSEIKVIADWKDAYNEIATGLEAVK